MEAQIGNQSNNPQSQIFPVGKWEIECCLPILEAEPGIICQYGVVVRHTSVTGMELVEFEFLPDAA